MLENLKKDVKNIGKPKWRDMLTYLAELHEKNINKPLTPLIYDWEGIGPGYCYAPAFGHWDIVHIIMDVLESEPDHAKKQLLNNLAGQQEDGLVPGAIFFWEKDYGSWHSTITHPSVWPSAVSAYCEKVGNNELIAVAYEPLLKLIGWYEKNRSTDDGGFYYDDIIKLNWECGVDQGVRFDACPVDKPYACVDACAHVYWLYEHAAKWADLLGKDGSTFAEKANNLKKYIQEELFDEETGFFYDKPAITSPETRHLCYEGIWPVVVGAATKEQANRVIDENVLNPERFNADHPITTVGVKDPSFELRMWRGPVFNSMTYWAVRGCMAYERLDAAEILLEKALDSTALIYAETGEIWEFYHPFNGNQKDVQRKPHTEFNTPSPKYLGHNPLIVMARMWDSIQKR